MVFDIKHDGRHKARLVAGGHLTDPNTESVYSGVVSLCGIRFIVFLAELNGLDLWGADVGHAYLEAKTKEIVYIVGGPAFGELEGRALIVDKELYGLGSSGFRWHERLADILLLNVARDPERIVKILGEEHKFKLKGVGTLTYHLECDYF
jgi:Reverse transcriptase (RNA-dependent DNA polymerase)